MLYFNNLLGGVLAQAELALEEYQSGSSPEEELKRIRDGAIRAAVLRVGSPGFPRRHSHPEDYLNRTIARALNEIQAAAFPFPPLPPIISAFTFSAAQIPPPIPAGSGC
jgi:hypothetical protein